MKKRIFITGIAGFIGFHSALALIRRNICVMGIDNFSSYYSTDVKNHRATLLKAEQIPIISGDICAQEDLARCIKEYRPTHILHLAAQAGVRASLTNYTPYVESNLHGFVSVLECIKAYPEIRLVYASSSSVYGNNTTLPFQEDHPVEKPANLYAATKRCNEVLAASYHQLYAIHACGLRFFTVYGPFGRPDMAYYLFSKKIVENTPLLLYANGKMQRDFTYIDDIVAGILQAIDNSEGYTIYNLASGNPISVTKLVQHLEQGLGKKAEIKLAPSCKAEVPITFASIVKAGKELGYKPQITFAEGISRFTQWFNQHTSLV